VAVLVVEEQSNIVEFYVLHVEGDSRLVYLSTVYTQLKGCYYMHVIRVRGLDAKLVRIGTFMRTID
jgi:hypothetical protein